MENDTLPPALISDADLRERLDRLGNLALELNDRVEDQTKAIIHASTMAKEARRATEMALKQTDPKQQADLVGQTIHEWIDDNLMRLEYITQDLSKASNHTHSVLKAADESRDAAQRQLWEREQKLDRFKSRLPWLGLGGLLCALVLAAAVPRFLASYPSSCAAIGAQWTTTTTGVDACVFYKR